MPKPQRLNPRDAWTSLEASFVVIGRVYAIDGGAATAFLARSAAAGVGGGRIYDAIMRGPKTHELFVASITKKSPGHKPDV